jgi:hypothetical protein
MPFLRQDQAEIHAGVNDVPLPAFVWQSLSGGDVQSNTLNVRPGGFLSTYSLGGPVKRNDATVKRLYGSSIHENITALENACGTSRMWISYTPLDADGNPNGTTVTLVGTLKQVQRPTFDAETSGVAVLTLIMDCEYDFPAS